jgi:chromatin remodeling complex protein RSC6
MSLTDFETIITNNLTLLKSLTSEMKGLQKLYKKKCKDFDKLNEKYNKLLQEREDNKKKEKENKKKERSNKGKTAIETEFTKPKKVSSKLSAFLGFNEGDTISLVNVNRKVVDYVKDNQLQCEDNRKNIILDDKLKELFGDDCEINFSNLNGELEKHFK